MERGHQIIVIEYSKMITENKNSIFYSSITEIDQICLIILLMSL